MVLAVCFFAGTAMATAQPVELINVTSTQWRYMAPTNDPLFGTDWKDPLFGDAGAEWSTGTGLFGTEGAGIYPYPIVTPINSPNFGTPDQGPVQAFFRTHFTWSGTTEGVLLSFTNFVDDAMVIFLNGTEILRFNVVGNPGDPVQFNPTFQAIEANPLGEPQILTVTIDPTMPPTGIPATLNSGDNVIAVYTTQFQQSSSDNVFGMSLHASQCIPASVQHPPVGGTNITIEECRTLTMAVQATGLPSPAYQWLHLGVPIPDATNSSHTVTGVRPGVNDGAYTVEVTNSCGVVTSPAFNVTITQDTTPPTMVAARVNPERTQVIVTFSEPLAQPFSGDEFNLQISDSPGGATINDFVPLTLLNETNIVISISGFSPWVEGTAYRVFDQGSGGRDACNNLSSPAADIAIAVPFIIRQGLGGYAGAVDIEIHQNSPDTPNATAGSITVDREDPAPFWAQGLLRFNDIFGSNPGQIPVGAIISSATLTLNQNNPGSLNNGYRMLIDWDANSTWNSFIDGVTNDGVEAMVSPDFPIPNAVNGIRTFDVTAALQAWANGAPNYGWAIISTGTDGLDIDSSDNATESFRPSLTIDFTTPPDTMLEISNQPPATVTANERETFSITWRVHGNGPQFHWQKEVGGVFQDISGSSATYTKAGAVPADSGTYRSYACNSINCVTSSVTVVTVNPDVLPPTVALTTVGLNQTTLVLTFSEDVTSASANEVNNYSISPNVGVLSAALGTDNRTVTLETGPRTFRTSYTLNVQNVQDTAVAANTMTATNITFEQDSMIIAGFLEDWKYELANQDGAQWMSPDIGVYDDALWTVGPGLFGLETSAGVTAMLAAQGLSIQTAWPVADTQPSYYVRKVVNVAGPILADTVFEMHHYVDDGAIAYVNGTEAFRLGFTNGQAVAFATYSAGAPAGGETSLLTNTVPLVAGNNLVAVEVHQQNAGSSDVVFGARFVAVHRIIAPTLTIVQSGADVTVSWTPAAGQLEESADLVNWSNSSRANGLPAPPSGGQLFYRVRR